MDIVGSGVVVGWYVGVAVNSAGADGGQLDVGDEHINESAKLTLTVKPGHDVFVFLQYKPQSPVPHIIFVYWQLFCKFIVIFLNISNNIYIYIIYAVPVHSNNLLEHL